MTENQSFLIVTRAGRQIDTVTKNPGTGSWAGLTTLVTNDRYWAVELDFDPVLDEAFGITVNKQQVSITDRMWEILEREGLPGHLAALRKQGVSARALKAKDSTKPESDTKRTSEEIMEESDKFQSSKNRANLRRNAEKTHPQIEQDASDIAESEGRDIGEVVGEILDETEKYPYQIEFESKPEAPFYRPELYGAQTRLWINKEHRFYRDVYNGPGSNTRLKTGLELLLLVLSMSELQSQGEKQMFYNRERSEWSTTLMTVLSLLNDKDPVDELEESSEMDLELSNVS